MSKCGQKNKGITRRYSITVEKEKECFKKVGQKDMEATRVLVSRRLDKEDAVHIRVLTRL